MTNIMELLIEKFEQIRNEIPISEIVQQFIQLKKYGVSHKGLCPFHSDHSIGSFVVTDSKRIYKCFSCGKGGDCIKFHALKTNQHYCESGIEIGYSRGIINDYEYKLFKDYKITTKQKKKIEITFIEKDREKFKELLAEVEVLDKVFRAFIKGNEYLGKKRLSDKHYDHLKNERMLSDEQIEENMFFTFPTRHILKYFLNNLEEQGIDLEVLRTVPGFFYDKAKDKFSFTVIKGDGIGIPIINENGQVVGIQIRRDIIEEKEGKKTSRYIWFSSSFVLNYDALEGGTGAGSPVDVNYPKSITSKDSKKLPCRTIFVTEGKFKSLAITNVFNSVSLSVQGVSSWRNTTKCVAEIRNKFKSKYVFDTTIIAYDADLGYNVAVLEQAIKMGLSFGGYSNEQINEMTSHKKVKYANFIPEGEDEKVFYALWDADKGKGIDDFINNGNQTQIRKISLSKMYNLYLLYKEEVYNLIEKGEYEEVRLIPVEIMKDYFETIILSQVISI